MKQALVLDDSEDRNNEFRKRFLEKGISNYDITTTADECIEALRNETYDVIFLDHDLGGDIMVESSNHNTGYTVAKWLCDNESHKDAIIVLHSLNVIGRHNMKDMFLKNEYHVIDHPWAWLNLPVNF